MKTASYIAISYALLQSVVGIALSAASNAEQLVTPRSSNIGHASIQPNELALDFNPYLYKRAIDIEDAVEVVKAGKDLIGKYKSKKPCKRTKLGRAISHRSGDECPNLPTKDQIKANWKSNPKFDPSKLFFYASPVSSDHTEKFIKDKFPGWSVLIPSFSPNGWEDTWAFEDSISGDFWKLASEAWAEVAQGTVRVLLPDGEAGAETWSPTSNWNIEYEILKKSPAVTKIIRVDVGAPHKESYMKGSA